MIITKYPDDVEARLKLIDKEIARIYREEMPNDFTAQTLNYEDI